MADARLLDTAKHSIKQVDRLLSNRKVDVWEMFGTWVPFVLGERKEAFIALDWTDFDSDNHAVIAAYLLTSHGRATTLAWRSVNKSELSDARNEHEDALLLRLHEIIPRDRALSRATPSVPSGVRSAMKNEGTPQAFNGMVGFREFAVPASFHLVQVFGDNGGWLRSRPITRGLWVTAVANVVDF